MTTAKQTEDLEGAVKKYVRDLVEFNSMETFLDQVAENKELDGLNVEQIVDILREYDGFDLGVPLVMAAMLDVPDSEDDSEDSVSDYNDWLSRGRGLRDRTNPS